MKQLIIKVLAVGMIAAFMSSCMAVEHTVGAGAQGAQSSLERQWYVLWGLVPINKVDSKAMASGKADYTVKTEVTPLDVVINAVTGVVSVYSQTVEVKH